MGARRAQSFTAKEWLGAALTVLLVVSLIVGGFYFYQESKATTVPQAQALEAGTPCKVFQDKSLTCKVVEVASPLGERGTYLDQSVPAGSKVRKGSSITLSYSLGPLESKLPELRNETVDSANKILYPLGLSVREAEVVNDTGLAAGRIVSSDPGAGTVVKNSTIIPVKVASGRVTVPDWKALSKEKVQADASSKNITVIFVDEETDGPAGIVVKQSTTGLTDMGTTVVVTISKPRQAQEVTIPKVVGMKSEDAQVALATAGITRIALVVVEKPDGKDNIVTMVNPAEGAKVKSTDTVTLTVEKKKP